MRNVHSKFSGLLLTSLSLLLAPAAAQTASLYKVHGTVFEDKNRNLLVDADEVKLKNEVVELYTTAGVKIRTAHTDASGQYALKDLASGTYRISHRVPDGFERTTDHSLVITVGKKNYQWNFGVVNSFPVEAFKNIKVENFDSDPRWVGINNRIPDCVEIKQDFKWRSESNIARGNSRGEIGGRLQRSALKTYYASDITGGLRRLNANDRLEFSARITVPEYDGGSGVTIGWFNSEIISYPAANVMAMRMFDARYPAGYPLANQKYEWLTIVAANKNFENISTRGRKPHAPPDLETEPHMLVGPGRHEVNFVYKPNDANGKGSITLSLDNLDDSLPAKVVRVQMDVKDKFNKGHNFRGVGAVFDRFGIYPAEVSSGHYTKVYIDDLRYTKVCPDGKPCLTDRQAFDSDPNWTSMRASVAEVDCHGAKVQDFGYTSAEKKALQALSGGTIGGYVTRAEPGRPHMYALPLSKTLNVHQKLLMRWKMSLVDSNTDSGLTLGWFHRGTSNDFLNIYRDGEVRATAGVGKNFLGVAVDYIGTWGGLSIRPLYSMSDYANRRRNNVDCPLPIVDAWDLIPNMIPKMRIDPRGYREFAFLYDPVSPSADGKITLLMFDERGKKLKELHMVVLQEHKAKMENFNMFGIMPVRRGGKPLHIYLDDVGFTR